MSRPFRSPAEVRASPLRCGSLDMFVHSVKFIRAYANASISGRKPGADIAGYDIARSNTVYACGLPTISSIHRALSSTAALRSVH